ncbi:Phospholipase/carboxylesterase [Annulohypoxylon maeteangense]|uniref:Phospholipase/carboxylesterase n=1 Tax=Annulohypoxylon maeteangense TaxID=1927788 RepID=UPI00200842D5|nr:Phospholipase/carboxylesterase [Annulohypoxylon maeteangense]KAI0883804.1 Phospholipase/carboxylesterase [Annulohypoxylon maeteangense]
MLTSFPSPKLIFSFVLFLFIAVAFVSISPNPAMAMRRAPPLLFPAAAKHTATVIFVHGLGDSGYGWASAVENWRLRRRLDEIKFILPHAPAIPVTASGGMAMPGWYDIFALSGKTDDIRKNQDESGILLSREYFNGLIQAEIDSGIPANRIVLGGFSQGGAISLFTGLTSKYKLAGIIGLSSYLLLDPKFANFVKENDNNHETPVLMCHGDIDQVVPTNFGKISYELLKSQGFKVTMKVYPDMGHSACVEELNEVEAFLGTCLPAEGDKKSEL